MMVRSLLAIVAGLLVSTAPGCSRREGLDPSKLPENLRADYEVFARKCSKCHSLARPLTANITDDEQWSRYVNRMRLQPGSGIAPDDQEHILRFLRYYAADLRRIEAEKNAGKAPAPHIEPSSPPPSPSPAPAPSAPANPATPDGGSGEGL